MPDIQKMQELIHPQAIVTMTPDRYGKYEVELIEPKEPDSKIIIAGIPDNTLVYNLDDFFPAPDQIFARNKSECCRADYILISAVGSDRKMVFIELKSENDDNAHIKNQLRGAECFSAYCAKILKIFWNYTMAWKQYNKHYVCFKYTNSVARSTRNDSKAPANTTIDKMLTLEGSHTFQYNQLIGRKAR